MFGRPRRKSRWPRRLLVLTAFIAATFVYSLQFHPEGEDWPGQRAQLAKRSVDSSQQRIEAQEVLGDVRMLASPAMQGRAVGTAGGKLARDYIGKRFAGLGLEPAFARGFEQPFQFTPSRGIRFWRAKFWQAPAPTHGANSPGRVGGTVDPEHYLLVSAHYDHLGLRNGVLYPGADDNASGVATMLAAARWFRAHPPRHSILFVAFDAEEKGLRGARAFVAAPPVPIANMLVDINFDMVSRNPDGEIFLTGLHANPQLRPLLDPVRAKARPRMLYGHDFPRPFWNMEDWTDQSDQGVFAAAGVPFVYLGVADHPGYHQPGDTFELIDQPFFLGVVESVLDLVSALDAADAAALRKAG